MKEKDHSTARDIKGTHTSNMSDREFKVMIMKIFTGLEKECISKVPNKDKKKIR